ncbi:phosphatidylserine decarboxylase [Entomophthora muscae]|uniref:Phosphatidylserine decarboxylase n=1 Tax=Entomophthora muscae TaxID=34485 RepID=A0ACC2SZ60_9FUNG|nr:phosphatidylserine decarboxylase [Entomophthora muscae]
MNKLKATGKIVKNTLNPKWDEVLEVNPDFSEVPTLIQVSCWDKDPLSSEFMGVVKIDPKSLFESDGTPKIAGQGCAAWYPLKKRRGSDKVGGEICMQVGFHVTHDEQLKVLRNYYQALSGLMSDSSLSTDESEWHGGGLLYIDIVSASDLPWYSNSIGTTFDMDPFVVASLGEITFKTSTIRHNRNPKWNERIVFRLSPELHSYSLKLSIYDYDKFSNNDYVGTTSVPITNILSAYSAGEGGKLMSLPLKLDPTTPKDRFLSKLLIRANYVPYDQARLDFWSALASCYDANEKWKHEQNRDHNHAR